MLSNAPAVWGESRIYLARAAGRAPDAGDQRHPRRLYRRWHEDGAARPRLRQNHLPPGAPAGSGDRVRQMRHGAHQAHRARYGIKVDFQFSEPGAEAVLLDVAGPAMAAAAEAYTFAWGVEPVYERAGGSVPITFECMKVAKEVVIMSYGLKSGRAHGPNENIYLQNFYNGIQSTIKFIDVVGNT